MDIDVERQHAACLALFGPLLPVDPPLSGDLIVTVGAPVAPAIRPAGAPTAPGTPPLPSPPLTPPALRLHRS